MKKILEVKDLKVTFNKWHQKIEAVRGLSFDLYEGETLGIVGESGSGKSSAIKALVKLHPESITQMSGQVYYGKSELIGSTDKEMQKIRGREIGMIFQDPMTSLNPTTPIGAQIIEGYRRHFPHISSKEARAYAIQMLHRVGFSQPEEWISAYPHTLSGGMRQRVMIALALAPKPKLLLADEPTTALDVTLQAQILILLKEIQQDMHTTILLITHDLSVVAATCDRVLVMYGGKIVESGPVHELFASPRHPYTQRLLQSIPRLSQTKEEPIIPIEGSPPDLSLPLKGCAFCDRCPSAMQICAREEPPLFEEKVHCWLYSPRRL